MTLHQSSNQVLIRIMARILPSKLTPSTSKFLIRSLRNLFWKLSCTRIWTCITFQFSCVPLGKSCWFRNVAERNNAKNRYGTVADDAPGAIIGTRTVLFARNSRAGNLFLRKCRTPFDNRWSVPRNGCRTFGSPNPHNPFRRFRTVLFQCMKIDLVKNVCPFKSILKRTVFGPFGPSGDPYWRDVGRIRAACQRSSLIMRGMWYSGGRRARTRMMGHETLNRLSVTFNCVCINDSY